MERKHGLRAGAALALLGLALSGGAVLAQDPVRTERVQFAPGATGATVQGRIEGYGSAVYLLGARAGQRATVAMNADNPSAYFNITAPGADTALHVGSVAGNRFDGLLPADGDYRIDVYLMRNAARRDEAAAYRLEMAVAASGADAPATAAARPAARAAPAAVPGSPEAGGPRHWTVTGVSGTLNLRAEPSTAAPVLARYAAGTVLDNLDGCLSAGARIWCDVQELGGGPRGYVALDYLSPAVSPDGSVHVGPDDSALRAGQGDFDARGKMPCAQFAGQPMGLCDFRVARGGGGAATVVVSHPTGLERIIFFANGQPLGVSSSEADPAGAFSATKEADLHLIRVGTERYELPDAVILGG